ncbi:MAG TPA: GNAT family N-acetyltransferase [Anaerovoracaceae bacterium]|nr:GNAT family N-acetyltransferase [Anaerovoracaceae bacterium]
MVQLKQVTPKDKRFFLRTINNKGTRYHMESDQAIPKYYFKNLINRVSSLWFVIEVDGKQVGLLNTFFKGEKYHFGVMINKQHRRKGYAKEAIRTFLKVTDKRKIDTYLECFDDNPALKLYKKLGYKETEKAREIRGRNFIEMKRQFVVDK